MIVTYENGDTVELYDEIQVPHNLGACTITIGKQHPTDKKKWLITDVVESFGEGEDSVGKYIHEKWFSVR